MKKLDASVPQALKTYISEGTPERVALRYAQLKEKAQKSSFGPFDNNLVVVDTEATGLSHSKDELIQIAAARVENGEISDWFVTFVNPGKPIPEEITHLTHIEDAHVKDAPGPDEALALLVDFVGDAIVVAHNVDFDKTFVTAHPNGYPLLENIWVDSLDLARITLPRLTSHRLIDLVRAFDAPISTHRADADVEATCAVLRILLAAVEAMPEKLVSAIASMASVKEWGTSAVFKYFAQGKPQDESAFVDEMLQELCGFSFAPATNEEPAYKTLLLRELRYRAPLVEHKKCDAAAIAQDENASFEIPDTQKIKEAFTQDGLIGGLYAGFEAREPQVQMACAVADAYRKSENLVVEAGTGVGKSMAYLLPSALLAKTNNISVGIATKTNALLDQLVYHELPALSNALGGLRYAPLKGCSHYPCLRKIQSILHAGAFMKSVQTTKGASSKGPGANNEQCCAAALSSLLSYIEQSDYDDMDALKIDYRLLPRWSISSTSQECMKKKCPFYGSKCFVHGARANAENADIIVTNHSLLFCNAAADGSLLPPVRYWVVDEAHGAEAEARRAFSKQLSSEEINALATRVSSEDSTKNVFDKLWRHFVSRETKTDDNLIASLCGKAQLEGNVFSLAGQAYTKKVKELLFFDTESSKGYEFVDIWINEIVRNGQIFQDLAQKAKDMATAAEKLIAACRDLSNAADEYTSIESDQREVAVTALLLKDIYDAAETIFINPSEAYAYSATLSHKKDRLNDVISALPFNVGSILEENFYELTHSVIYSSATLAVGNTYTEYDFKAFEEALGINESEASTAQSLRLDSSYDFEQNMTIFVPSDMPEPNNKNYLPQLSEFLVDLHMAQHGSILTLFTNRREMEACYDEVHPKLKEQDLQLLCQKKNSSIKALRDEFVNDEALSLFALKSFWEGFDAPGATLRGVVISKLPFAKPSDPLSMERASRSQDAWMRYVLPAAVIDTKQAAGRLIRAEADKGILVLADHRLLSKSYGKTFLNSMPSSNIKIMTCEEIIACVQRMHEEGRC